MTISTKNPTTKNNDKSALVNKTTVLRQCKTKKKGKTRVNSVRHGGYAKDPLRVLKFWRKYAPQNAKAFDKLYLKFRNHIKFRKSILSTRKQDRKALKILCIKMVSRDLMMGITVEKDFTMYIKSLGKERPHFLLKRASELDFEIQNKLLELGLIGQDPSLPKKEKSFLDI